MFRAGSHSFQKVLTVTKVSITIRVYSSIAQW
jgi:hypothetical protein